MIVGIGTDIAEIKRIEKIIDKGFCKRYFSESENAYFESKNMRPETVTGSFAAKEAFSKALGTGFLNFSLKDVEILHDDFGKPYTELHGDLKKRLKGSKIFVSISHCKEYATAFVVIEKP